ncbi:hypothetical protein [Mesorhizobium sp.]|uniref:hypothetical protein n=1 Tax=Mesorhizobium sp. TaxID=1871066 RepID=UPI0025BFEA0E|nr:hypothetical protein [Mesorhizobium sp.]
MAADEIALANIEIGGDARVVRIVDRDEVHAMLAGEEIVSEVVKDRSDRQAPARRIL